MRAPAAVRWSGYVLVAILFAIGCAFLSHWQFERGAERDTQLELIAHNYDADPVALAQLIPTGAAFDPGDRWRPVEITGEYLTDQTLLVRNRPHGGTSAFEVLVPLRTDDGRVFLIDRGWVPPGREQPEPDSVPEPPEGEVTVTARLSPGEPLPPSGRSAPEGQVPTINLPLIAGTIGESETMIADAFGILVSESPAPVTSPQPLEDPSDDPGPHLSYAIQWILFAIMGFVFIWYMIRTEIRARKEEAEDAAAAHGAAPGVPTAARRRRGKDRRDRDMQDEDALLDELSAR